MRKGLLKRILAGFMVFALTFMSVDAGCITAMAADLQDTEQELQFNTGLMPMKIISATEDIEKTEVYEYQNYVEKNYSSAYYTDEWEKYSSYYIYNQLNDEYKKTWDEFNEFCLTYLTSSNDYELKYIELPDNTTVEDGINFVRMFLASNPQYYFLTNKIGISYIDENEDEVPSSTDPMNSFGVVAYDAFVDGEARSEATEMFKQKIDIALDAISSGADEASKVKLVHDYIANNVKYNYDALDADGQVTAEAEASSFTQSAYSTFCLGLTVCAGYSEAMQLLCNALNIDAFSVTSVNHQWNKIRINDSWYNFDVTWADQEPEEEESWIWYKYYARNDVFYNTESSHISEDFWGAYLPDCTLDSSSTDEEPGNYPVISNITASPVINAEKIDEEFVVTISSTTPNATIYYTVDGTTPSVASTKSYVYDGTFNVVEGTVVNAIAVCNTYWDSAVVSKTIQEEIIEIVVEDIPEQTYSGSAITPDVVVTTVDGTTTLVKGTDYTLSYSNNTNAGTATVTISFIGNYAGKEAITKDFTINPMSSGDENFLFEFVMDEEWAHEVTYTGQEIKLGVTVTDGVTTLVEGKDYTVKYPNDCVNVGMISVTVTLINNYSGSYSYGYDIVPKVLTASNITPIPDQVYFAQDIEPELVIKDGDYVLVKDKDYTVEYEGNNSISAEAKALVTFKGNYINEVENEPVVVKFSIIAKSQEDLSITIPGQVYDGTAKEPDIIIMYNDKQLVKDIDYEVSFRNNINVGNDAIVHITFIDSYAEIEDIEKTFTISALELNEESVEITGVEMGYVFTGYEIYIDPVIMYNGTALRIGEDYTIGYSQNRNVGNAIYYIEFIGNYSGRIDGSFVILQKELTSSDIVLEGIEEEVEYSGETTYNNVVIRFGNIELVKDKDYSIGVAENSESDGVKVGTVTLEIVFLDNYSGATTVTYEIVPKNVAAEDITVVDQKDSYEYTGQEIEPDILVSVLGDEVEYRIEYIPSEGETVADTINVGTVTYKVILTGNYYGEITKTFSITPVSADKLTYKVDSQVYTGLPLTPNVVITYGDVTLVSGTDYTLVYDEIVNAGTTQIVVNLTGNYSGCKEITFVVTQKSGVDCTVSAIEDQEFTGEAIEPEIEVKDGNTILIEGTDYTVTYTNNTHAGEANVTITYKGNYSGSESITFNIIPVALDNETLTFVDEDGNVITEFEYVYTRDAIIPDVIVSCGELMFTKDDEYCTYEIVFAEGVDHTNVGTVEFTVVLKGDFSGEITGTFEILPKSSDELAIDNITAEVEYTGEKIIPTITIYHSDAWEKTLVKDDDFVVTIVEGEGLSDGIEVGTVKLCISFIGNYSGEPVYRTFEIVPAEPAEPEEPEDITSDDVDINDETGYISKITAGTTVKAFLAMLDEGASVQITDKDGKVVSNDALLGTGMKVSVMNGTEAVKTYVVIVTGDTNGDGKISITDMIAVKAHLLKKELLTGASEKAADVAGSTDGGDGKVSITDFIKVKAHLLKKETVVGVVVK